jgi:hypothetical protein
MKKTTCSRLALLAAIFAFAPLCISLAADNSANTSDAVAQPATASTPAASAVAAPVKLPYGVEDVLKLSRAQIGDSIILNYIQSSGTIYNLAPKDIVYLRDQGVSDQVLNAMLDQRKRVELASQAAAAAAAATSVANAPTVSTAPMAPDASTFPVAPTADQSMTYAEAPLTPPASSVYVIPYPAASYAYYGSYYPYYYGPGYYGGWYGPSVAFGFRFGGHGGFHGGHGSFAGHGGSGGHHR